MRTSLVRGVEAQPWRQRTSDCQRRTVHQRSLCSRRAERIVLYTNFVRALDEVFCARRAKRATTAQTPPRVPLGGRSISAGVRVAFLILLDMYFCSLWASIIKDHCICTSRWMLV